MAAALAPCMDRADSKSSKTCHAGSSSPSDLLILWERCPGELWGAGTSCLQICASGKSCWAVLAMVAIIPSSLSTVCPVMVPCGMVMVMMVTWLCCLGLRHSASDSPNHAVRRAVPSQSLGTAQRG